MNQNSPASWLYPRYRTFFDIVKKAASIWFKAKGYAVDPKYSYILAGWND